jgi:hypothetical protein
MEIVIHYPKTENEMKELQRRKSALDARLIGGYISKLDCPLPQKKAILDSYIKEQKQIAESCLN